jgi:hypothetical protein
VYPWWYIPRVRVELRVRVRYIPRVREELGLRVRVSERFEVMPSVPVVVCNLKLGLGLD